VVVVVVLLVGPLVGEAAALPSNCSDMMACRQCTRIQHIDETSSGCCGVESLSEAFSPLQLDSTDDDPDLAVLDVGSSWVEKLSLSPQARHASTRHNVTCSTGARGEVSARQAHGD
jgi:hypothetical protein